MSAKLNADELKASWMVVDVPERDEWENVLGCGAHGPGPAEPVLFHQRSARQPEAAPGSRRADSREGPHA